MCCIWVFSYQMVPLCFKFWNLGIIVCRIDPKGVLNKKRNAAYCCILAAESVNCAAYGFLLIKWFKYARNLGTGVFLFAELIQKECSSIKRVCSILLHICCTKYLICCTQVFFLLNGAILLKIWKQGYF